MRKCILLLGLLVCLTSVNVFAEEFLENTDIDMSETVISEGTYSDIPIQVIQYTDNQPVVIYSGTLGGYDNGRWSDIDISGMQSLTVLDWDNWDDGAVYIIPLNEENEYVFREMMTTETINIESEADIETETDSETETEAGTETDSDTSQEDIVPRDYEYSILDIGITKQDGTLLNSLKSSAVVSSAVIVKNSDCQNPLTMLAALYDDGILQNVIPVTVSGEQLSGTAVKYDLNIPLGEVNENSSLRLMLWDGASMRPYSMAMTVYAGYSVNVSAAAEQVYTIPVVSNSSAVKYKIKFDGSVFETDDLCKETDEKEISAGTVSEDIRIDEVTSDSFTFTFTGEKDGGCVNRFSLKALKSADSRITVYEINE